MVDGNNKDLPVLLIFFNRQVEPLRVVERIKDWKPSRIYLSCDGARRHVLAEKELVESIRSSVESAIDWPCDIRRNYSEHNLGCKNGVRSALDWFFADVDYGVVLEDDCLPSYDFYEYCNYYLLKYKASDSIGMISGNNFDDRNGVYSQNDFLSRYGFIWGWATWSNVWQSSREISDVFERKPRLFENRSTFEIWIYLNYLDAVRGRVDTWDYQWINFLFSSNRLTIVPKTNLVTNIGFSGTGTHTDSGRAWLSVPSFEWSKPTDKPSLNEGYDEMLAKKVFNIKRYRVRIKQFLYALKIYS